MKILKLTSADATKEDRSIWVNFDFVEYIESRYNSDGKTLNGARIHFVNDTTILVEESVEDIIRVFSTCVTNRTGGSA